MLNKTTSMKKNIQQSLEQLGYRKTLTRTTILRALESFNRPVSVEDLVEKCQDLNLTTIYRNLHVMEEHGLIRSMQFTSKAKHYVIAEQDDTKLIFVFWKKSKFQQISPLSTTQWNLLDIALTVLQKL
jgi:Fe2+ or Zn2+ uptake regulation protein